MDDQQLKTELKLISEEHWGKHQAPVLLSNLPPILRTRVPEYKKCLGTRSLKNFIKEVGDGESFQLIEHPTQKAKLGIAPAKEEYKFPVEKSRATVRLSGNLAENQDRRVLALLHALANLPSEDLERVVIPISTLVNLLK